MKQKKHWKILNQDINRSIIDVILENRGFPPDHMDPFKLSDRMHSPYLLPDMEKGVNRILDAMEKNQKICVFGDYDVDGITSTAIMIFYFRKIGYPVSYRLPHREKDGYGLRVSSVEEIAGEGIDLIITVDNGISSTEAIEYAGSKGIDVVVTDHHLQEAELPEASAVINPNRVDSKYPFKTICGAAVAFKVIYALSEKTMQEDDYKLFLLSLLDLVAIGTISDVMPIRDENYALVKFGLKVLSNTKKPGLIELKKISGIKEKSVTPISVGFFLAPRLNAAGRLESAATSVELVTTTSVERARELSAELNALNTQRQGLQATYLKQALDQLPKDTEEIGKVIFVENESWQAGLIGLVSGQLKERFNRPAFAFTKDDDGNYVGSARSVDAFHVTNALTEFSEYFIAYGGHKKAAGLTVASNRFETFKKQFINRAAELIDEDKLVPEIEIDSIVSIREISINSVRQIQDIGPFGESNPEPLFLITDLQIRDIMQLSHGKHLKLFVQKANQIFECVWWGAGQYKDAIVFGEIVDIVFKLSINSWQGTDRIQLTIEDLRSSEVQDI